MNQTSEGNSLRRRKPMKIFLAGLLALGLTAGCGESPSAPPSSSISTSKAALQDPSDYVPTPAGWMHRSCVHVIGNDACLDDRTGIVTRQDGSTYVIPKCQYSGYRPGQ